jgi:hypothetical protein
VRLHFWHMMVLIVKDDRTVVLSTNPQPSSVDGKVSVSVLTWEKIE